MSSSPLEGIAVGGPRHGVRLSAPISWDGLVRKPGHTGHTANSYYAGNYKWRYNDEYGDTWVWVYPEPVRKIPKGKSKM